MVQGLRKIVGDGESDRSGVRAARLNLSNTPDTHRVIEAL
jgi:hypothetical protein